MTHAPTTTTKPPASLRGRYPIFYGMTHTVPQSGDFLELSALCQKMIHDADSGTNPYLVLPARYRALLLDIYPGGPPWEYAMATAVRAQKFRAAIRITQKRIKELLND